MALLLNCDTVSKAYGLRPLFTRITFGIGEGERLGLIGPNGSGKSTLLKILAGLETPDEGDLAQRRSLRLGYVPQEEEFPAEATVEEVLLAALAAEPLDAHERFVKVDIMLGRMQFAERSQTALTLSGGWKKRLAIARALITEPELLLLDEPTNHLDLDGILWLEKLLKNAPFGFILVSHDRYMLENVTNRIVELNRAYPEGYFSVNGPYSEFLQRREEFLSGQITQQNGLTSRVRQEVEWLQRGARARATKAKGRIEEAGRLMEELAETKYRNDQQRAVQIEFTATQRKTKKLLVAKGIAKTLGERTLFKRLDLTCAPGMKLGLLGANGSGKTTLLRVLTGELAPDAGTITLADGVRVVLFQQNRQGLDRNVTLREALSPTGDTVFYRGQPIHVTAWGKRFLFQPEQLPIQVSELSGGEQSRILIARMMLEAADILILDEPTNDLDIPSLEVLEESLADFPGTLILVTHDRFMMDRLCGELLYLDGQGTTARYAEYAQWERAQEALPPPVTKTVVKTPVRASAPSKVKLTWKEERELEQIEETLLAAEAAVAVALQKRQDPAVFADHVQLHAWSEQLHAREETLKRTYARWEELEAKRVLMLAEVR